MKEEQRCAVGASCSKEEFSVCSLMRTLDNKKIVIQENRFGVLNIVHELGPHDEELPIRGDREDSLQVPLAPDPQNTYLLSLALR